MIKEFREFINKGNVLDLAVAVIIGAAFGKIVTALVEKVIMPPIGLAMGGVDFKDLKLVLQQATMDASGEVATAEVAIGYGAFLQSVIDFLIVAFVIFLVIKGYNKMQKAKEEAPAPDPGPSNEEVLLGEIRDLLKK